MSLERFSKVFSGSTYTTPTLSGGGRVVNRKEVSEETASPMACAAGATGAVVAERRPTDGHRARAGNPTAMSAAESRDETKRHDGPSDPVLLKRWRGGDQGGFHALMTRYERPVFRVIWKVVRNDEDARDLMQETFLRLWKNADKIRDDVDLHPWLFRTGTNLAIDHLRKYKPGRVVSMVTRNEEGDETMVEPQDRTTDPRIRARRRELESRIRAAVAELPKRQRTAMVLRSLEELSTKQIAKILECQEKTVGTTLFAARQKLIKRLRPLLEELQELAASPAASME